MNRISFLNRGYAFNCLVAVLKMVLRKVNGGDLLSKKKKKAAMFTPLHQKAYDPGINDIKHRGLYNCV